jgi:formate dehydrogenase major subunit
MHQANNGFHTTTPVSFLLNGKAVTCRPDDTILEVADKYGVEIPRLCYMEGMRPDGNCRTCMV